MSRQFIFPDEAERRDNDRFEDDEVQTPKESRQISQTCSRKLLQTHIKASRETCPGSP